VADRAELADFLRGRRESLQPEDVGLPRGQRRRTGGLRREEVAVLCGISTDYYSRIEQQRGPRPSEQMLAALARGLHLTLAERDYLFQLGGHPTPQQAARADHVDAGTMRILDRLDDTPAQVISAAGETLLQTRLAVALLGDQTSYTGLDRSTIYRWFTQPESRGIYVAEDHDQHGRVFTATLHRAYARGGKRSRAAAIVDALLAASPEFAAIWAEHDVNAAFTGLKRFQHPRLGYLELHCQTLLDPDQSQVLLVFTAIPGSESQEKLQLLSVIGDQRLDA
jgi:transcriptional regulator with XRE-family HTH domain